MRIDLRRPEGRSAGGARQSFGDAAMADIRLVIATPCFGGQVSAIYAASMFRLQKALRAAPDIELKILLKDGDALITRARASLAAQFLDDPDSTHLLFVDADIGFEPAQVLRLIDCGADVCAAVYPIKRLDWERIARTVAAARPKPGSAALRYVYEVDDDAVVTSRGGFVKVRYAGTGFLLVQRAGLERMCAHYPALRYARDHSLQAATESANRYALFDPIIDPSGTYLSEDFSFCSRWTSMGGEIWADLASSLDHVGPTVFHGDFSSQFAPVRSDQAVA
jgi:hypothetical protein